MKRLKLTWEETSETNKKGMVFPSFRPVLDGKLLGIPWFYSKDSAIKHYSEFSISPLRKVEWTE